VGTRAGLDTVTNKPIAVPSAFTWVYSDVGPLSLTITPRPK